MISIFSVYAITWALVLVLYMLRWSSLNTLIPIEAFFFFIVTISISTFIAVKQKPKPSVKLIWREKRNPIITILITVGFFADWAYSGRVPMFAEYQGFDPSAAGTVVDGIPGVHVILTAMIIFYIPYLFYRFLCTDSRFVLIELVVLLLILLLNKSRGYMVFTFICCIFTYLRMKNFELAHLNFRIISLGVLCFLLLCFFISVAGNVRHGLNWNDCSYIEEIGYFDNYPKWLTQHFMWAYSYITSSFGNLMYNLVAWDGANGLGQLLYSFLPESISAPFLPIPIYQVQHLNACTGYVSAACSFALFGMGLMYTVQMAFYWLVIKLSEKKGSIFPFTESMFSFLVLVTLFYSPFTTSAVCYIPFFLMILELYVWIGRSFGKIEVDMMTQMEIVDDSANARIHDVLRKSGGSLNREAFGKVDEKMVSIIVPIYNQEKYLSRILKLLSAQTHHNIEIVAVDDGSTDASLMILGRFAQVDQRVRIVCQENQGLLSANVTGIRAAKGDYIVFVDPDDIVGVNLVQDFLRDFDDDYDFVARGFYYKYSDREEPFVLNRATKLDSNDLCGISDCFILDKSLGMSNTVFVSRWNKMYKRRCLESIVEEYATFRLVSLGEDSIFTFLVLKSARSAKTNPVPIEYYYVQHRDSMMNSSEFMPYVDNCQIAYEAMASLATGSVAMKSQALVLYYALVSGRVSKMIDTCGSAGVEAYEYVQKNRLYRSAVKEVCKYSGWRKIGPILQVLRCPGWIYQVIRKYVAR